MPSEWAARCEDVRKVYVTPAARVEALRGVTARFPRGALTALVGPSGSGKSSLLRVLATLDRPTEGEIWVDGGRLGGMGGAARRKLRRGPVGYLFQRPSDNFIPHLTVADHVRSFGGVADEELLEELGLAGRGDHLPAELSGGEQQRAALAQVLSGGARLVVADEPTAELDEASARGVLDRMRARVAEGVTFIVGTHDPNVIRQADAVVELDHGRLRRRSGSPEVGRRWRRSDVRGSAPAPRGPVVTLRSVTKSFHRGHEVVRAVRGVTVSLHAGEVVGLIGRSGSGKTTLLHLLAGWERPDAGRIEGDAFSGAEVPPWARVAVVPQRLGLIEELSIRANVALPARLAGVGAEHRRRVEELLASLALDRVADRAPREVSVGEQQRTALARALLLTPALLLADEPSGHQDPASAERVFGALRAAAERGTSCLVATHDEDAAARVDRVLRMADGVLTPASRGRDGCR